MNNNNIEPKDEEVESGSRHKSLDQLAARVEERYREQQTRNNQRKTKSQVEKQHAQYLRLTYGGSTSGSNRLPLFGSVLTSGQSTEHGRQTIGVDARVNLGNSIFGMSPSSSSSSLDSMRRPGDIVHPTALSVAERLQQQREDNEQIQGRAREEQVAAGPEVVVLDTPATSSSSLQECAVMNCSVNVSSRVELALHMDMNEHSPCNPCRHLMCGLLKPVIEEFVCPVCLLRFKSHTLCLEHMVSVDHKALMSPVSLAAYACPHCLLLFPSHHACSRHIQDSKHHTYAYAFRDDESRSEGSPVPMPTRVVQEFIEHCRQVPWVLECISCEKKINPSDKAGKGMAAQHLRQKHMLMATTDLTPGEVFGLHMIKGFTCIQCLRLFESLPDGDMTAVHECRQGVLGMFIETTSDCTSFEQYIIRYALGPIKEPVTPSCSTDNLTSVSQGLVIENPSQPHEGGVYLPPDSSATSCLSKKSPLPSMHSVCGPFHPPEIRNSGPSSFNPTSPCNSDSILARSVSSSALLTKAKCSQSSTSSTDGGNSVLGKSSSLSVSVGSHDEVSLPPTESSSAGSAVASGTSTESFVTAVSRPEKRFGSDSDDDGRARKKQCRGRSISSSSDDNIEHVEITSSLENLSMDVLNNRNIPVVESNADRQRKKRIARKQRRKEKELAMRQQAELSDSSRSNDSWLKVNPNNGPEFVTGSLFNPRKKLKTTASQDISTPGPSSGALSSQELDLVRMFSDVGRPHGWERDTQSRQGNSSAAAAAAAGTSSTSPIVICDSPITTSCQTSSSLKSLSPAKGIQTSSSLVGVQPDETAPIIGLLSHAPNIPDGLDSMQHIVFLDLDNWGGFWTKLPKRLPDRTFVWGFYGGSTNWNEPRSREFRYAKEHGLWHIHKKCSRRKDAADFAICLMVGKLDERLPKHIPFTILSGDHGFLELEEQMRCSRRRATVINPHHRSDDEVYTLICSVGDI